MPVPPEREQFVGEPIEPSVGSFDARSMARGEPGLPGQFRWRGVLYTIASVLEEWKTSTPEAGSGELYLRRHWYTVRAVPVPGSPSSRALTCTLYCIRHAPSSQAKRRWWLYSFASEMTPPPASRPNPPPAQP